MPVQNFKKLAGGGSSEAGTAATKSSSSSVMKFGLSDLKAVGCFLFGVARQHIDLEYY
jgi:hypothetical protein